MPPLLLVQDSPCAGEFRLSNFSLINMSINVAQSKSTHTQKSYFSQANSELGMHNQGSLSRVYPVCHHRTAQLHEIITSRRRQSDNSTLDLAKESPIARAKTLSFVRVTNSAAYYYYYYNYYRCTPTVDRFERAVSSSLPAGPTKTKLPTQLHSNRSCPHWFGLTGITNQTNPSWQLLPSCLEWPARKALRAIP